MRPMQANGFSSAAKGAIEFQLRRLVNSPISDAPQCMLHETERGETERGRV